MESNIIEPEQKDLLLDVLSWRFAGNMGRHPGLQWDEVLRRLEEHPEKLWSLRAMEETGGEPDVIGRDKNTGEFIFCDCAPESPKGRRSLCYDPEALQSRKEHKPRQSAIGMAEEMGISLLNEERTGNFSNWGGSIPKPPAGLLHHPRSGSLGEPFSVTGVTIGFLSIITAPNPIMPPEGFAGC